MNPAVVAVTQQLIRCMKKHDMVITQIRSIEKDLSKLGRILESRGGHSAVYKFAVLTEKKEAYNSYFLLLKQNIQALSSRIVQRLQPTREIRPVPTGEELRQEMSNTSTARPIFVPVPSHNPSEIIETSLNMLQGFSSRTM